MMVCAACQFNERDLEAWRKRQAWRKRKVAAYGPRWNCNNKVETPCKERCWCPDRSKSTT